MRRALPALLALGLAALTSCSNPSANRYDPNKTLTVTSPDLVALKKHTDVPDCPLASGGSVDGGMPTVTLSCLGGGRAVDMAGLRGPMIVNFWASWCGACKDEMPALAAYAKSQSVVQVIGVDFLDPHPDYALELAKKSNVAYPLVTDPNGALDDARPLPHIQTMPETVFVAANGSIAHIEAQSYASEEQVAAAVNKYLGVGG